MYCQKCGQELSSETKFCPHCGAQVSMGFRVQESQEPVLVMKPVFLPWITVLSALPIQISTTIFGGGLLGMFGSLAVKALKLNVPGWFPVVFFGCVFFFAIPIMAYIEKKKGYESTEYRFYRTKLEYYEGFFTVEEKTMSYTNITEIYLSKGIFQKKYGLGTIVLSTRATGDAGSTRARSGIRVADIPNPDEVYTQIKELVNSIA